MIYVLLRVLHVLGVVIWIGGVAMVTAVILPAVAKAEDPGKVLKFFHSVEHRFKPIAQVSTVIVGVTGFCMVHLTNGWWMFTRAQYWWMHAMVLTWLVFTVLLFILEPMVVEKPLKEQAQKDPAKVLAKMQRLHWILLTLSLITVLGAVAGAHGLFLMM